MAEATLSGIVLEVGVPRGVDVMTAYANRSARYDNHAGASIVWDRPSAALDAQIDALLKAAGDVAGDAGVIDPRQLTAVRFGEARVLLLGPDEVRGIQGPIVKLSGNPHLGEVLRQGSALMRAMGGLKT